MKELTQAIIGQVVAGNYRTAGIFTKFGIDFCCKGNRSIEEACRQKNIDPAAVATALEAVLARQDDSDVRYDSWPLSVLINHILQRHHQYVTTQIPVLQVYLRKLCSVHGKEHPELEEIRQLFDETASELIMHMKKEELVLFPFIQQLAETSSTTPGIHAFGKLGGPVEAMMHDHDQEGERFRKIASLSHDYTPPPEGCTTYKVTYAMLKEFEEDLHLHIHLENNILFPKALQIEGGSCSYRPPIHNQSF